LIHIRPEEPSDWAGVHDVVGAAFHGSLQADLVDVLRQSADPQISLVAVVEGELVGHIFFSPVTFESRSAPPGAQLSPVSVAPAAQRMGVGAKLIRSGLKSCFEVGWLAVVLVGNPAYYSQFGFRLAGEIDLHCEGEHDRYLQYLELRPGSLVGVRGLVSFHQAFSDL